MTENTDFTEISIVGHNYFETYRFVLVNHMIITYHVLYVSHFFTQGIYSLSMVSKFASCIMLQSFEIKQ